MFLKFLPKDVDLAALVQMSIITLQSTLMRVQEITDIEARQLSESEMMALRSLLDVLGAAEEDTQNFYNKVRK